MVLHVYLFSVIGPSGAAGAVKSVHEIPRVGENRPRLPPDPGTDLSRFPRAHTQPAVRLLPREGSRGSASGTAGQ